LIINFVTTLLEKRFHQTMLLLEKNKSRKIQDIVPSGLICCKPRKVSSTKINYWVFKF